MKLLAFELATEACSVALWVDGEVRERFEVAPRRHAELALPWAEALLAQAGLERPQLDAIAVGRGPGAFTGVRLAIAIGQGIALALDRPIVPVSTLAALAAGAGSGLEAGAVGLPGHADGRPAGPILAAIDARMGEIYSAGFQWRNGRLEAISDEVVVTPDAAQLPPGQDRWHGVGTGFAACEAALESRFGERFASIDATALPRASAVAALAVAAFARGEAMVAERIEPAYLRNHVALTTVEQKALRASKKPGS